MPTRDSSLPVRRAVVAFLRADETLGEPLPVSGLDLGGRVHEGVPAEVVWPYVRYGVEDTRPLRATGLAGNEIDITIHAFAEGETSDDCRTLCDRLVAVLDGKTLDLAADYPAKLQDLRWTGTQVLRDIGSAEGWHGVVRFVGAVVS